MSISVSSFGATHVGYARDHNEDSYICAPEQGLWIVADGVGGYDAGEIASAIVVDQVKQAHQESIPITQALLIAHQSVIDAPGQGRGKKGMGSTVVALVLNGSAYEIVWVGDSRAYLWNGTSLVQLTQDHTHVQRLVDQGAITEEEAFSHPLANVLDQAIGLNGGQLAVDQCTGKLLTGERLLLCSDGLSGEVPHQEIESAFNENLDDHSTTENLINAALAHGGADNITAIVVSIRNDIDG